MTWNMAAFPKITVGLVLYKGEKYLDHSIPSLLKSDYPGEIEFLLRDQSPEGEAKNYLESHFPEIFPKKIKILLGENLGHSGGHNALMRQMTGEYYVCVSNDMLYAPDAIFQLISALEQHKEFALAAGKSRVWDFVSNTKTEIIDTVGLGIDLAQQFFDVGQGETDFGQYNGRKEIFGASGAYFAARKTALENIAYHNNKGEKEYFDRLLHYKNDIDLMYRFFWAGEKCLFVPESQVWHDRQAANRKQEFGILKSRKRMSRFVKADSLFGQLVLMSKHVFIPDQPISVKLRAFFNFKLRLIFTLLIEPWSLSAIQKYWRNRHEIRNKTQAIIRKSNASELQEFLGKQVRFGKLKSITAADAIILDYFKAERVKNNVTSLSKQQTSFDLHLVVADNSCNEQNAAILRTLEGGARVKVMIHPGNLGYARGNNQAAFDSAGEVIFIVNPDIISPDPHTLQSMADYLAKYPDVAIVGPKQKNPDSSYEKTARRFPTLMAQLARRSFLKRLPGFQRLVKSYEFSEMDMETTQEVDWLQSSFWAVRKDFWDYLGGFDEYYAIFMADVEMCWQAWAKGMKVVYFADAQVEADGIRCSRGTIFSIFKSRMIRIHSIDAVKFWWRHLFEKNPRF